MGRTAIDLTGQRFGRWMVLERVWRSDSTQTLWLCRCDCGNMGILNTRNLRSGKSKSCGCLQKEAVSKSNTIHGMRNTRLYTIWLKMKNRCQNSNHKDYHLYGGRGITVCNEWQQFEPFYEWAMSNGYSEDLTIDRINNDGGYSPDNCRWATVKEQANNKRNTCWVTYNGETRTLSEWSELVGIKHSVLQSRICKLHWDIEKAFTTPVRRKVRRE